MNVIGLILAISFSAQAPMETVVDIELTGLRSGRGLVHACLTRDPAHFPECRQDPHAITQSVPASVRRIEFHGIRPGRYAIALFHDENSNHRLDTFLGIPREGFGFSRNPRIRFGAPRFDQVSVELAPGPFRTTVEMKYLL